MSRSQCSFRGRTTGVREQGFVLVGVVMFILALTILGLSLFALSSFEGQFHYRSHTSVQSLNAAQSGLEHAKFVLAQNKRLQDVRTSLYPSGVVYARAKRLDGADPDTVGNIEDLPQSTPVAIRVLANLNGERRMVETHFLVDHSPPLYKRLMSITDSLYANEVQILDGPPSIPQPACVNTYFSGEVWEGGMAGNAWASCVHDLEPSSQSPAELPTPDVTSFFARHLYDPQTRSIVIPDPAVNRDLDILLVGASGDSVTYFRTTSNDTRGISSLYIPKHDFNQPGTTNIHVSGRVVWMLREGLRVEGRVIVHGGTDDCLVIVAGSSTDTLSSNFPVLPPPVSPPLFVRPSLAIRSSLTSLNVPVILVTSGWVVIQHAESDTWNTGETINYLSVFARAGLFAAGGMDGLPIAGQRMNLRHPIGSSYDQEGDLIDQLCRQGALPNSESGGVRFTPVAGTWHELDPDNPPN